MTAAGGGDCEEAQRLGEKRLLLNEAIIGISPVYVDAGKMAM